MPRRSLVAVSIGVRRSAAPFATYATCPEGATAIAAGLGPSAIVAPGALFAVAMVVTVPAVVFAT